MKNFKNKIALLIKNENFVVKGLFLTAIVLSLVLVSPQIAYSLKNSGYGYGYSSGSYGYGFQYSDALPSAPTSLSASNTASSAGTTATLSWTAPTTTTNSTSYDNPHSTTPYLVHYGTSSLSACSGGSSTTSTTTSASLSGLTANTVYYAAICAYDDNTNTSSAVTTSFTPTVSAAGGGGGGAAVGHPSEAAPAEAPAPTAAAPGEAPGIEPGVAAVTSTPNISAVNTLLSQLAVLTGKKVVRDLPAEQSNMAKVVALVKAAGITIAVNDDWYALNNFVTYGISKATYKLGSGERLAVVKDAIELIKLEENKLENKHWNCIDQMASGEIPAKCRDLRKEQVALGWVLPTFKKAMGQEPDFKITYHDMFWNAMLYKLRPSEGRNLAKEIQGVIMFKLLKGHDPRSSRDWAVVKGLAYFSGLVTISKD